MGCRRKPRKPVHMIASLMPNKHGGHSVVIEAGTPNSGGAALWRYLYDAIRESEDGQVVLRVEVE